MMIRTLQRTPYAGALLSGLLVGIAFPPGFLGALAWIGLVPLLLRLSSGLNWRVVVLESLLAWATTTVIVGYWVLFHPILSTRAVSLAGLMALAVISSLPFWLFGIPGKRASLFLRFAYLFGASAVVEYAQFHTEVGFPWLALGHTQASVFPINQLAAFVGTPGLSAWVLASNALVLPIVLAADRPRKIASGSFGAFLLGSLILGFSQFGSDRKIVDMHSVLAVQPAISAEAWSNVYDRDRPSNLIELTRGGVDTNLGLIIWPETSLPILGGREEPSEKLASFVDSAGIPLLTGAVIKEAAENASGAVYYNSAIVLSPFAGITARYDKRILVPFAERVPYVDQYPWLGRLAVASGGVEGYDAGSEPGRMKVDGVNVGILICFESAFGRAARTADQEEVAYFVVLAQDGWWGDTAGYEQHFAITRLRAIETGRAVMQVTVTGTTGLVLPDGASIDETEWMDRTVRAYEVPVYRGTTPYTRFGDLPMLLFGVLLFLSGCGFQLRVP